MYILEDTLAMLGAVFVVTSASMFAHNEDDDTPIELEVIPQVEDKSSWYDIAQKKYRTGWSESVPIRNKCQFSWYCDGKSDRIRNSSDYQRLYTLAAEVITGRHKDNTEGALWYHADHVQPSWRLDYNRIAKIDSHIFYVN